MQIKLPLILCALILALPHCSDSTESVHHRGGGDFANGGPQIERLAAYDSRRDRLEMESLPQLEEIDANLLRLFQMIQKKDLQSLPEMVHPGDGVFIDLKAHRSIPELKEDLEEQNGYFEQYYLNTGKLQKATGDDSQLSIHDLLEKNEVIKTEYYLEPGGTQVEVKFTLSSTPDQSFRLNNAVFIKRDNHWYFLQLL